jgi:hypothetical protein
VPSRRDLIFVALLLFAGLAWLNLLNPAATPIKLADESIYLSEGINFHPARLHRYEGFPLHLLWYNLLHVVVGDPVVLFKAARILQLGLMVVVLGVTCTLLSRQPLVGLLFTLAVLTNPIVGSQVQPYAQHTALIVLLLGFIAVWASEDPGWMAAVAGLTFFVAAFAHSEYVLAFYLVSLGLAVYLALRRRDKVGLTIGGTYLAGVAGLTLLLEFPMLSGARRSFIAFGQHYTRHVLAGDSGSDAATSWQQIVQEAFPGATSVGGAALGNPLGFLEHVGRNMVEVGRWLGGLDPLGLVVGFACLAVVAVHLFAIAPPTRKLLRKAVEGSHPRRKELARRLLSRTARSKDQALLVLMAVGLATVAISVLVIFPRRHYMQPAFFWLLLMGAHSLRVVLPSRFAEHAIGRNRMLLFVALAVLLVAFASPAEMRPDPVVARATLLRQELPRPISKRLRALSMYSGLCVYASPRCKETFFARWPVREQTLGEYLQAERIDLVILNVDRIGLQKGRRGVALREFADRPAALGFEPYVADAQMAAFRRLPTVEPAPEAAQPPPAAPPAAAPPPAAPPPAPAESDTGSPPP